jgi:hypothetical protein
MVGRLEFPMMEMPLLLMHSRSMESKSDISIYLPSERKTKILYVESTSGEPLPDRVAIDLPFKIQGLVLAGPRIRLKPGYSKVGDSPATTTTPPVSLFVMSVVGELFLVQEEGVESTLFDAGLNPTSIIKNDIPKIHMPPNLKRTAAAENEEEEPPTKKAAIKSFMGDEESAPIATSELPLISGSFMRAFVGRHLLKRQADDE